MSIRGDPISKEGQATYLVEMEFAGSFMEAARTDQQHRDPREEERRKKEVFQTATRITPRMLAFDGPKDLYDEVRRRFVTGEPIDPVAIQTWMLREGSKEVQEVLYAHMENPPFASVMLDRAQQIEDSYRLDQFRKIVKSADAYLHDPGKKYQNGGQLAADRLATKLMGLYSGPSVGGSGEIMTPDEIVHELIRRTHDESLRGVPFPYSDLDDVAGPMIPGEVLAITGYSNAGKSSFACNLFWAWVRRQVHCIAFSTEMGLQWAERGIAANARVPQRRVEKRLWDGAPKEELDRYLAEMEAVRKLKDHWQIIPKAAMSPLEVMTSTRILRQRWKGHPVVVFVDHMHRLDYGDEKADEGVGAATRMFRNMAKADTDGGLIWVLLYQPKKPDVGKEPYGPVGGHKIRGHSEVWNEIDVHLSPGRMFVKIDESGGMTEWGTPKGFIRADGWPELMPPDAMKDDRKLDDERFWLKVDKRRVGGEGPLTHFAFDPRWGQVYQPYDGQGKEYQDDGRYGK